MAQKTRAIWIGQGNERDALFEAAVAYIKRYKGKAVIIGPIELQHWPEDHKNTFRLAIRFTGKPPQKPKKEA